MLPLAWFSNLFSFPSLSQIRSFGFQLTCSSAELSESWISTKLAAKQINHFSGQFCSTVFYSGPIFKFTWVIRNLIKQFQFGHSNFLITRLFTSSVALDHLFCPRLLNSHRLVLCRFLQFVKLLAVKWLEFLKMQPHYRVFGFGDFVLHLRSFPSKAGNKFETFDPIWIDFFKFCFVVKPLVVVWQQSLHRGCWHTLVWRRYPLTRRKF